MLARQTDRQLMADVTSSDKTFAIFLPSAHKKEQMYIKYRVPYVIHGVSQHAVGTRRLKHVLNVNGRHDNKPTSVNCYV